MSHALPFSRPLLATEHTEQDRGAQALAFALVRALDGSAPLATVMPLASNPEYEAEVPQAAARAEAELALRREALQAEAAAAGVALEVQVRRGSEPYAQIVDAAREARSDLLVIRRRGKRGLLANLLIGEMVGKVLAHAPCSVLVTPREVNSPWRRAVLAGVDPERPQRAAVALAAAAARAFGSPLHLVAAVGRQSERDAARAALAHVREAAAPGAPGDDEVRVGAAHAAIVAAAGECGADLIVVARHGGAARGRAWVGGTAQKVIGLAGCPVLVVVEPSAGSLS
jgi:hypothetical protein